MEINQRYKKIIELLNFSNGKYSKVDVFRDFILMFAISIQNTFYYIQEYEDLYFQVLKKFKKEEYYIFYLLVEELVRLFINEDEG